MADMSKTVDFTRKKLRGADRERFLKLVGAPDAATQAAEAAGGYQVVDGAICRVKATPDGPVTVPLANFNAKIIAEEVRDNGAETATIFVIEGFLQDGRPLGRAEVSASSYPGMAWVTAAWGTRPVVYAGQGTKDHLRAAIQLLSGEVPRRVTYGHTGWRKLDGCWHYLHAGGAIGPDGAAPTVAVSLAEGRLQDYALPVPPEGEDLRRAVRASLGVLNLAPAQVAYPLLQAVYRAPLAEALPVDLSLFLAGATGCQKTELTAIAQAHWGPAFHGKHLPGNWDATANALEKLAFLAKDAVFVVDDFAPGGTVADVQRLHREADRLLRAQGNRSGRVRMSADTSLKPEYYPRGLIIRPARTFREASHFAPGCSSLSYRKARWISWRLRRHRPTPPMDCSRERWRPTCDGLHRSLTRLRRSCLHDTTSYAQNSARRTWSTTGRPTRPQASP